MGKLRLYIVLEALCGENMDAKLVTEHKEALDKFINNGNLPAPDVLWAFDTYIHMHPATAKGYAMTLKVCYDEDWASEAAILEYYRDCGGAGEPGFDEAKKAAGPFLKWLETVESEEDDDDGDEEDDSEEDDD